MQKVNDLYIFLTCISKAQHPMNMILIDFFTPYDLRNNLTYISAWLEHFDFLSAFDEGWTLTHNSTPVQLIEKRVHPIIVYQLWSTK